MFQSGSGKTTSIPVDWDTSSSTINVQVPEVSVPVLLAFQLGSAVTMGPKYRGQRGSGTFSPQDFDDDTKTRERSDSSGGVVKVMQDICFTYHCFFDFIYSLDCHPFRSSSHPLSCPDHG